jgi:hypothetical protein
VSPSFREELCVDRLIGAVIYASWRHLAVKSVFRKQLEKYSECVKNFVPVEKWGLLIDEVDSGPSGSLAAKCRFHKYNPIGNNQQLTGI